MDLLGDIVEKNISSDEESLGTNHNNDHDDDLLNFEIKEHKDLDDIYPENSAKNGFPELYKPTKISSWKQRLRAKKVQQKEKSSSKDEIPRVRREPMERKKENVMSEAQSIHMENLNRIKDMTDEQFLNEKRELLESLNPKLIKNLLSKINKRLDNDTNNSTALFPEVEGASGTWVGGINENVVPTTNDINKLPSLLDDEQVKKVLNIQDLSLNDSDGNEPQKEVRFEGENNKTIDHDDEANVSVYDDYDDVDDVAPLDYQMAQTIDHMSNEELMKDVHFITHNHNHSQNDEEMEGEEDVDVNLDINDPDFDSKLHEKYFPDLPKDIDKLKWFQQVPNLPENGNENGIIIEDVSQCRFDFNGNLIPPTRKIDNTTHSALHHHATDPQLAGYTIPELQHLSISNFPSQRCISIQILGRILYKLGKQTYYQLIPEVDVETYQEDGNIDNVMKRIYSMFWDLCKTCNVIESLEIAANESFTKNLSVRNYAIDALWLWRKGGGDFRISEEKRGKTDSN
ncbi:Rba50p NDAI_0F04580 [Naumovozyma dairenensis CBS 421]|uniref:RNA polymerase II-associated protein RBA50 n=1 Tax=Naumovozyma dairenensis (strain ATCC 10597 / BCRC 20456 / CBS 421 / NBRC 0211 / NRRL Y-12639) TaxID=1071378 RepID=G0WDB5_NAUDC|nr:hypothetical protein NDAI_0F04580 [Naumovozyma dairenensis CBS 421]CCD25776.1 hypothetical protein NDAI_0F04580 [Naumovozyma dairenensis CBS 421]